MSIVKDKLKLDLVTTIVNFYKKSRDFNGFPFKDEYLNKKYKDVIISLVEDETISLNWGDPHPNQHIKAFNPKSVIEQLTWLKSQRKSKFRTLQCCMYPTPKLLKTVVSNRELAGKPFSRMLLLGRAQLDPIYFDSEVLFEYIKNPKYQVQSNNIVGSINSYNEVKKSYNDFYIPHFGYGISKNLEIFERCIAVMPCDLKNLDAFNQKRWLKYVVKKGSQKFFLHPEYAKIVCGNWPELSVFEAFTMELEIINKMANNISGCNLFKNDFKLKTPLNFNYIFIPSKKEFFGFISTLNNLMGDNLNLKFFKKLGMVVTIQSLTTDNQKVSQTKGTIRLLDEWLQDVKFLDPKPKEKMISTFKKIQELRSKGTAHNEVEDELNIRFYKEQQELIRNSYGAIRTLRLILTNHPLAKSIKVPENLFNAEICLY